MNQSKIKAKILLIAILSIAFVFLLLVCSIVEIKKYNDYTKQLSAQEREISDLQNLKDYYNSNNYDENASRDNGNYTDGDIIFEEE